MKVKNRHDGPDYIRAEMGISILVVLFSLSCDLLDPSSGKMLPLEGNVNFFISEEHWIIEDGNISFGFETEPRIALSMRTEKIYMCGNYTIEAAMSVAGDDIFIDISGIIAPDICYCGCDVARAFIPLDIREGVHRLHISYGIVSDSYIFTVMPALVTVREEVSRFTAADCEIYWRYPQHSFASSCRMTGGISSICDDFFTMLTDEIALEEFRFPEYGQSPYYFYPDEERAVKFFLYENDEDFDRAGEILNEHKSDIEERPMQPRLHQYINIRLRNWKNKCFQ